jgi:glutathione S-transferase
MKTPSDTTLPNRKPRKKRKAASAPDAAAAAHAPQIELWQKESCPFSHSVRDRLSELGLDYVARSVNGTDLKHRQLVQAAGRDQIPFLVDHRTGVKLHESAAIIAYLNREYGPAPSTSRVLKAAQRISGRIEMRRRQAEWVLQEAQEARTRLLRLARGWMQRGASPAT